MILHDVHSWTPGWSTSRENNKVTVITDIDGEVWEKKFLLLLWLTTQTLQLPENKVLEINEKSLEPPEDLCKMEELHESLIMENLKRRFKENTIYVCFELKIFPLTFVDLHWPDGSVAQSIQDNPKIRRAMHSWLSYKTCRSTPSSFVLHRTKCLYICIDSFSLEKWIWYLTP